MTWWQWILIILALGLVVGPVIVGGIVALRVTDVSQLAASNPGAV